MAKEEKASTSASALSRLEHHIAIVLRTQTLMEHLEASKAIYERTHEESHPVVGHLDMRVDNQSLICNRLGFHFQLPSARVLYLDLV